MNDRLFVVGLLVGFGLLFLISGIFIRVSYVNVEQVQLEYFTNEWSIKLMSSILIATGIIFIVMALVTLKLNKSPNKIFY